LTLNTHLNSAWWALRIGLAIAAYALARLTEARATATEIQPMFAAGLGRMTA
jgi:hypothetical protein